MWKVLPLSWWKKHPQPEREEYSDDEDSWSTDLFKEPGVGASKRKRKPEIKSSKETKAASENNEEKKASETTRILYGVTK